MKNRSLAVLAFFIKLLLISVSLLLLALIFILFTVKYEHFVDFILRHYGEADKIERLKSDYLSIQTFELLKYVVLFFTLAFMVVFFLLRKWIPVVSLFFYGMMTQLSELLKVVWREIGALSILQKFVFFTFIFLVVLSRVYYLFQYPLIYDEVFSYVYFTNKGLIPSAVYYPGPNNHIFFSELCVFINQFLNDPMLVMRIPSLVAGILSVLILWIFVKRKLNFEAAMLSSVLFSFSYNIFYYSIHGRGYSLFFLFFMLAFISLLKITETGGAKRIYKLIYLLSCVLGFYTIPVFLYPYVCFLLFGFSHMLIFKRVLQLKYFFILNVFVGLLVMLLYLPVLFLNGWDAVSGNAWVKPIPVDVLLDNSAGYFINVFDYLWNLRSGGWIVTLILFVSGVIVLFIKKEKKLAILGILLLLMPPVFLFIQKVLPFFRVWDYLLLVLSVFFGTVSSTLLELVRQKKIRALLLSMLLLLTMSVHFYQVQSEVQRGFPYYSRLNNFLDTLFSSKTERVYVEDDTYRLFILFRSEKQDEPVQIHTKPLPMPMDVVVIPQAHPFPSFLNPRDYSEYVINQDIRSYLKK